MAFNENNDLLGLLKSGLSLAVNIAKALELQKEGRPIGTHGLQAGKDLLDVGERISKLAAASMQRKPSMDLAEARQRLASLSTPRGIDVTGNWGEVSLSTNNEPNEPNKYIIHIHHNNDTGAVLIKYPRMSVDGFNEFFGAVNGTRMFVSGPNSRGERLIASAVIASSDTINIVFKDFHPDGAVKYISEGEWRRLES
jgi:hypothetical protein